MPEVVRGDRGLVRRQGLAALPHAKPRLRGPRTLREAVDDVAEVGERVRVRLAIAIARAALAEVRHAEMVLDLGEIRARRMHPLEVAEGGDRFGVPLAQVIGLGELQLRILGVRVEGVLVEERLVPVGRELVRLVVEGVIGLAPELVTPSQRRMARDGSRSICGSQTIDERAPGAGLAERRARRTSMAARPSARTCACAVGPSAASVTVAAQATAQAIVQASSAACTLAIEQ